MQVHYSDLASPSFKGISFTEEHKRYTFCSFFRVLQIWSKTAEKTLLLLQRYALRRKGIAPILGSMPSQLFCGISASSEKGFTFLNKLKKSTGE